MNFEEYQDACRKTAFYPRDVKFQYLRLGVIGEIGELANQYKKALRDDGGKITPERREKMRDELGDVAWYLAMWATERDVELEGDTIVTAHTSFSNLIDDLLNATLEFYSFRLNTTPKPQAVMHKLARTAYALGLTLPELFDRNIAKLADRQARGTLSGSGDSR